MSRAPFAPFLERQGFVVLDGGLATALEAAGRRLDTALWSARLVLDDPGAVRAVHAAYLEAGADCITTAGYQASFEGLRSAGLDEQGAERALRSAVEIAVEARDSFWTGAGGGGRVRPIVAASAGPYGAYLADGSEYHGRYGVERETLVRFHEARFDVLADTGADVVAFETIPSGLEAEVVAELARRRTETPVWMSFTCRDEATLRDGTPVSRAADVCAAAESVVALGVNCTAPEHVAGLIRRIVAVTDVPVVVYPNSGEAYDGERGAWTGSPEPWVARAPEWYREGARILGGCCRVGPDRIAELRLALETSPDVRSAAGGD